MNREQSVQAAANDQPDEVSHQASAWFALMQGGSPTQSQREALAQWLAADTAHAHAYTQLQQLWDASALLLPTAAPAAPAQLSRRRFVGLGLAASAAAVSAGAATFWLKGAGSPFADLYTAVGERRVVKLADGSSVELAGNTALNIDLSATRRSLQLLRGEAFFTVAPSAAGELRVSTEAGDVFASDAAFCLSCEGPAALLAVNRHGVRVAAANQQAELSEGLSLRFSADRMGPIQQAEMDQVLAWRSGRLVFFDKPLQTVVDQLQQWRQGRIFIMDKQLAARRVSLVLNLDRPEQMLDVLTKALAVRTTRYTDLVTLIYPA
jgi:transmembrane sensor